MKDGSDPLALPATRAVHKLSRVLLPGSAEAHNINLSLDSGTIESVHAQLNDDAIPRLSQPFDSDGLLVLPSLCHPHIHLDKPHLLTHSVTTHLQPTEGSFSEALSLTAKAKPLYTRESILERMHALLVDSSRAGVTHIRGFAEVDATVQTSALDAALEASRAWAGRMHVQVCAFAQDPVFSGHHGDTNRALMESAVSREGVEALGSTPYVESDQGKARANIEWAVRTAISAKLHLDLHLDYNVDANTEALVWWVIEVLNRENWVERMPGKTVCLGHCTRLTLFNVTEWTHLRDAVRDLPVYFVGLPTSDLFMMGRPSGLDQSNDATLSLLTALQDRGRCTLQVPAMIDAGFNACIGVNNVGNAFTPYGSADPLALAQWGVGIYQAGTVNGAVLLFECISMRAKNAIGITQSNDEEQKHGDYPEVGSEANFLLIGRPHGSEHCGYRRRKRICEVVWDAGSDRKTIYHGKWVRLE